MQLNNDRICRGFILCSVQILQIWINQREIVLCSYGRVCHVCVNSHRRNSFNISKNVQKQVHPKFTKKGSSILNPEIMNNCQIIDIKCDIGSCNPVILGCWLTFVIMGRMVLTNWAQSRVPGVYIDTGARSSQSSAFRVTWIPAPGATTGTQPQPTAVTHTLHTAARNRKLKRWTKERASVRRGDCIQTL